MTPPRMIAVAMLAVAATGLTACDGSGSGGKSSTPPSGAAVTSAASDGGSGGIPTSSGTSGGSTSPTGSGSRSVTKSSRSSSASSSSSSGRPVATPTIPSSAPRAWRTYQPLPTSSAIRAGTAIRLISMSFDALDGGWTLNTQYRAPSGAAKGQLVYFALVQSGRAGAATAFRLQKSSTFSVFMTGTKSPRPTDVVLYQSGANGAQGKAVLKAPIPGAAFVSS